VGVDMGAIKSEFLADYWSRHGAPLRARALGNIHKLSVVGAAGSRHLSNLLSGSAPVRWLNEKLLEIDRRRTLPAWKRETFERWIERNPRRDESSKIAVTLFNDTFTNHYDPEIGIAALEVLERGGARVNVVRPVAAGGRLSLRVCWPRPARIGARRRWAVPYRGPRREDLFCEPSCLFRGEGRCAIAAARRSAGEGSDSRQGLRAVRRVCG